jgi:hypothetical protein
LPLDFMMLHAYVWALKYVGYNVVGCQT